MVAWEVGSIGHGSKGHFFSYKYLPPSHPSIHPSIDRSSLLPLSLILFHFFINSNSQISSSIFILSFKISFLDACIVSSSLFQSDIRKQKQIKMSSASCVNQVSVSEPLHGIGSILGFECDQKPKYKTTTSSSANSFRRTLSADMSSKKWLTQHEFSFPLKKIASSDELQIAAADDDKQNDFPRRQQQPGQLDIWCSILIQKPSSPPPPYVHPLVKQSKSSLTMKSLEICTENLGSESGSDGFSSYPPSEISYSDNEEQEEIQEEEAIEVVVEEKKIANVVEVDNKEAVTLNYSKKLTSSSSSVPRSFPPPLNSLSRPGGGILMKPHRKDGRLVLEAVSVPNSQNYFHAQRQNGRLVLTFASPVPQTKSLFDNRHVEQEEDIFETDEIGREEESTMEDEEEEDRGIVLEVSSRVPKLPTGVINVHRSALMMNRFNGLANNKNNLTTWSSPNHIHLKNKSEKIVIDQVLLPQSLPSPPTLAAGAQPRMSRLVPSPPQQTIVAVEASSLNTYEYCWRRDTSSMVSVSGIPHPRNQKSLANTKNIYYYNNNSNNILTRKNNYCINNNNLFARDSTLKGGKDFKEEKHNGEKVIVDHMVVPAYSKACKQEPRRALWFWEPYCIATS